MERNLTALAERSLQISADWWTPLLVTSIANFCGLLTNSAVIMVILGTKKLHNKSQYVILSHSLSETLNSLAGFIVSTRSFYFAATRQPDVVIDAMSCIPIVAPYTLFSKLALYTILALGFDRFFVVGMPIFYKSLSSRKYLIVMNAICWGLVFVRLPVMFLMADRNAYVPLCTYAFVFPPSFQQFQTTESNVLLITTALVYAMALAAVGVRYWSKRSWESTAQRAQWMTDIRRGAFRMMFAVGFVYLSCWGLVNVVMNLQSWGLISINFGPHVAVVLCANTASHFFIYLALGAQFRRAVMRMFFCRKTNEVSVINAQGPTGGV